MSRIRSRPPILHLELRLWAMWSVHIVPKKSRPFPAYCFGLQNQGTAHTTYPELDTSTFVSREIALLALLVLIWCEKGIYFLAECFWSTSQTTALFKCSGLSKHYLISFNQFHFPRHVPQCCAGCRPSPPSTGSPQSLSIPERRWDTPVW